MKFESIANLFRKQLAAAENSEQLIDVLNTFNTKAFRVSLLHDQERRKIGKLLNSGQEINLDKIKDLIGRKRSKEIHWQSINLANQEREGLGEKRKMELLRSGQDQKPLILNDGIVSLVNIHGLRKLEDINAQFPEDFKRQIIEVDYQENTSSSNAEEITGEVASADHSKIIQMPDASGKVNPDFLKKLFEQNNQASFVMTGGNLRGCFLESLRGILNAASKVEHSKVDFHVPLDRCYDDDVYDKITNFKNLPDAISRVVSTNSEIYQNGELVNAIGPDDQLDSQFRFYLWDKAELMINKIKSQLVSEDNLKKSEIIFKNQLAEQNNIDENALLKIRNSLKSEI